MLLKSETRSYSPNSAPNEVVDIWCCNPGFRCSTAQHLDPIRKSGVTVLSANNPKHDIYSTFTINVNKQKVNTLVDTGAVVSLKTRAVQKSLKIATLHSDIKHIRGVDNTSIPAMGRVMLPLILSPTCTVYATAYVVDTLPHTMQFILGQPFLRKNTCSIRFAKNSLHFEIANKIRVFRISRLYAENACKTPRDIHEISASQLNSLHKNSVYSARVSVMQRDFKVQEIVHPAVQRILDRYPTVMSGIPPSGKIHRDSYCKIEL